MNRNVHKNLQILEFNLMSENSESKVRRFSQKSINFICCDVAHLAYFLKIQIDYEFAAILIIRIKNAPIIR